MRLLGTIILLLGASLVGVSQAASFADLAAKLPACGLSCFETAISASSCTFTNSTCICADTTLIASATACLATACTVKEQLQVAKIEEEGCGVPVVSQKLQMKIVTYIFCILAELCVIIRVCTKLHIVGRLGVDDWVIVLSGITVIPYFFLLLAITDLGLGLNMWDTNIDDLSEWFKLFWAEEIVYLNLLGITKVSILLFLVQIFPKKSFRISCYVVVAATVGISLSFTMATIFGCRPISTYWTQWQGLTAGESCNNLSLQTLISGAVNIVQDFAILILPLPELYRLQVSTKKKIQLFSMFSVGFFVSIISVIRLKFLVTYGNTTNPTKDYVDLTMWSVIEVQLSIVCACMPSLRQLFNHFSTKGFFASTVKTNNSTSRSADHRIYQSRSFKLENKMRGQNDDFHELTSITNVSGSDGSIEHPPGKLDSISIQANSLNFDFERPRDEETGDAHITHHP